MKIPKIFIPEKDLEEKVQELAGKDYTPKVNVEEQSLLEERLQQEYCTELKDKRKKWGHGDHLNKPGTNETSPQRLIFNSAMMVLSLIGAVYLFKEARDYIPQYLQYPSICVFCLGLPAVTYKTIAEVMIKSDIWKKYKGKR